MAVEISNIPINLCATSIVVLLKEKPSLVNFDAIAVMFGCFLYVTIDLK